jgi:hypothetical protein
MIPKKQAKLEKKAVKIAMEADVNHNA